MLQPQKFYNTNTTTNHALNHACFDIILGNTYISSFLELPKNKKSEKTKQLIFSGLVFFKEDPQVTINECPTNKSSIKINN